MAAVKHIKGERTRVMHEFAAQMELRGYSTVKLRKRQLVFSRERGQLRQEIAVYFLSHTHSQGKAYIGSPHCSIDCPQVNQLVMHTLDMKRDTLGTLLWRIPLSSHHWYWTVSGHIPEAPPITTAIDDIQRYLNSHVTIESIMMELMEKGFSSYPYEPVIQALAAAFLTHREDFFDEIAQKTKAFHSYSQLSILAKKLKEQF